MILRVFLIAIVILLCLLVVVPFFMNVTGFRFSQFGFIGSGESAVRKAGVLIRSTDSGKSWSEVTVSEERGLRFPNTILDLSFHPKNSDILYLGTKGGGLWMSETGGASWKSVADSRGTLLRTADVYKVVVSRSNPEVMHIAVFQENRGALLKSEDGGKSFTKMYVPPEDKIGVFDVWVDPFAENHVFIATGQGGLLETRSGGRTWRVHQWFSASLIQFFVHPFAPREMYVRTAAGKLFRSVDQGEQWTEVFVKENMVQDANKIPAPTLENPFAFFTRGQSSLVVFDPNRAATLYAGSREGLLRSTDGGATWRRLGLLIPPKELPIDAFAVLPGNSSTIFAAAANQLYRSEDGGTQWNVDTFPTKDHIRMLVVHPLRTEIMFAVVGR